MRDKPERNQYNDVTRQQSIGIGEGGGVFAQRSGTRSQWERRRRARRRRGGPPVLQHNTPSDGDEVSKAVDQPIVNSVSTADSEVFPQGGQGTHAQLLRRPSVEIIAASPR